MNPECRQGKHTNCNNTSWDEDRDEIARCRCACHLEPTH